MFQEVLLSGEQASEHESTELIHQEISAKGWDGSWAQIGCNFPSHWWILSSVLCAYPYTRIIAVIIQASPMCFKPMKQNWRILNGETLHGWWQRSCFLLYLTHFIWTALEKFSHRTAHAVKFPRDFIWIVHLLIRWQLADCIPCW